MGYPSHREAHPRAFWKRDSLSQRRQGIVFSGKLKSNSIELCPPQKSHSGNGQGSLKERARQGRPTSHRGHGTALAGVEPCRASGSRVSTSAARDSSYMTESEPTTGLIVPVQWHARFALEGGEFGCSIPCNALEVTLCLSLFPRIILQYTMKNTLALLLSRQTALCIILAYSYYFFLN